MRKENSASASKKLTVLALVLFIIFTAINVFWMITMYIPYCGYSYSLAQYESEHPANKQEEKYSFVISKTPYLGYDDYISVGIEVTDDMKGIVIGGIYIYPNIWGDYEYAVGCTENGDSFFMMEIDALGNFIPFDENDTEFNEKAQKILNDKQGEITQLIQKAKDCWGLDAKHDLKMGIKGLVNGQPLFALFAVAFIIGLFCLIISVFIWLLKYKFPFENKFTSEMNDTFYGKAEYRFKRTIGEYEFFASEPQLLRNNPFLAVKKLPYKEERLTLVIFLNNKKEKMKYYALLTDSQTVIRKAEKVEFEYICGKALSTNQFIIDHNEEIADLAAQANLFWPI